MQSPLAILLLGLLLGVRHAFDADHLVAVSTIVSEYRNPLRAVWIGVSWGLGHTTTLLLVALGILLLKVTIPAGATHYFELAVGIMLVILGIQVIWRLRRTGVHLHSHTHGTQAHAYFHSHTDGPAHSHQPTRHSLAQLLIAGIITGEHLKRGVSGSLKPFFRIKSYVVGTVHGLAGSAALMLVVLAGMESRWLAVWYIVIFGLGSMVAMGIVTVFLAFPFSVSARLPRLNQGIQIVAAIAGISFGLFFIYQAGIAI